MQQFIAVNDATCITSTKLKTWQYGKKNIRNYEGWNFNSGNYLFTTDTK